MAAAVTMPPVLPPCSRAQSTLVQQTNAYSDLAGMHRLRGSVDFVVVPLGLTFADAVKNLRIGIEYKPNPALEWGAPQVMELPLYNSSIV